MKDMNDRWTSDDLETDLRYVVCKLLIFAPPERVWQVLTDYNQLTKHFSNIRKTKTLKDRGAYKVLQQQVQPIPPIPPISYVVEVQETYPTLLEWRGMTPYIKTNQGRFGLQSVDEGRHTLVTFAAWAEAALLVPAAIIRDQLRKIMPEVLVTLKKHAEVNSL